MLRIGIPTYRTLVQYIPQRPSLLPGTPLDFLTRIQSFSARSHRQSTDQDGERDSVLDPFRIAEEWGIPKTMWGREWSTLSGGEGQRVALAIAIGLGGAEVVLLDGKS
jgi:ABC-type iron transport system FetAB ATPase subunit